MSAAELLTTYGEMAEVLANVGLLAREARRARGLSGRTAAKQMGVSFSTLSRVEKGDNCQADNYAAILRWLDQTPLPKDETSVAITSGKGSS